VNDGELREQLVWQARRLLTTGLVKGTSGNLSARAVSGYTCLITPSGVDYESMRPEDIVAVDMAGEPLGPGLKPSVDAPVHVAIYRARRDVAACIHTHSLYAAAFSVVRRPIPPLLAESAGVLGGGVRVIDYVPPARTDTGDAVARGLGPDRAVLLPNHGVIAVGADLGQAFAAAMAVEESAHVAYLAEQLGRPEPVAASEIARMHDFIHNRYGQR